MPSESIAGYRHTGRVDRLGDVTIDHHPSSRIGSRTRPEPAVVAGSGSAAVATPEPVGAAGARALWPGLALAAGCTAVAMLLTRFVPALSPLTVCVLVGVVIGNTGNWARAARPGLDLAARRLLRIGVVLLGLRLAVPDVLRLGGGMLAVVVGTVLLTFVGTQCVGRLLKIDPDTRLLVATGFSICGASAIAAMSGATGARRPQVVTAVTMVTLYGSLAMLVLPLLQHPLGLSDHDFGMWVGASIHDVAQTVAAGSVAGPIALSAAIVVKLTRVVLLAPIVAGTSAWRRRTHVDTAGKRPPLLPLFVVGFLAMVALRSTGLLPAETLADAQVVETACLSMAMVGLGSAVRFSDLRAGGRVLLLGAISWVFIAAVALGGVLLAG